MTKWILDGTCNTLKVLHPSLTAGCDGVNGELLGGVVGEGRQMRKPQEPVAVAALAREQEIR
eukprot:1967527-Amphidinium_carterae.1